MIPKTLGQLEISDIQELIQNNVRENLTTEYKRAFPAGKDQDKVHFLKAVTSLANTAGGDVFYGVEAKAGIPTAIPGIPISEAELDDHQLKLENMIREGVDPRMPAVEFKWLHVGDAAFVLVIRVKRSWNAPHRVTIGSHNHFYGRNSVGAYPLDVTELRAAFVLSESVGTRAKEFITDRLIRIGANRTPVPLMDWGIAVLHILPMSAFAMLQGPRLDATKDLARKFSLIAGGGSCPDVNLDGAVHFEMRDKANHQYTQIFRNGCVEMVSTLPGYTKDVRISGNWLVQNIVESLALNIGKLVQLEIGGPFIVSLSFVHIGGYALESGHSVSQRQISESDSTLILPDVLMEGGGIDAKAAMRPTFDILWNAFGFEDCTAYDANGNLRPA